MDDVAFGHNGLYGDVWKAKSLTYRLLPLAALWYRGGVWCLWKKYKCLVNVYFSI